MAKGHRAQLSRTSCQNDARTHSSLCLLLVSFPDGYEPTIQNGSSVALHLGGFFPRWRCLGRRQPAQRDFNKICHWDSREEVPVVRNVYFSLIFPRRIPLTEILGLESTYLGSSPWTYRFGIVTFKRVKKTPNRWVKRRVVLKFRNLEHCQRWRKSLSDELDQGFVDRN